MSHDARPRVTLVHSCSEHKQADGIAKYQRFRQNNSMGDIRSAMLSFIFTNFFSPRTFRTPVVELPARAIFRALGRIFRGLQLQAVPSLLTGAVSVPPIYASSAMMSSRSRDRLLHQPAECQQQKIIVSVGPDEGWPLLPALPTGTSNKGDAQRLPMRDDDHVGHPACLPVPTDPGPSAHWHHPAMRERTEAFVCEARVNVVKGEIRFRYWKRTSVTGCVTG